MTFEEILQRMLNKVPNDIDKREGSIIYNALAPAAFELAEMYIKVDSMKEVAFASKTYGKYLDYKCLEVGLERHKATHTSLLLNPTPSNINIPIGTRFGIEGLYFCIESKINEGSYILKCEVAGEQGNAITGELLPVEYIDGLESVAIEKIISRGNDEEDDTSLLERYYTRVKKNATSGNANNYEEWANSINGVGAANIFPLWNGAGTVKVVIINDDKEPANDALIKEVKQYIETVRPIGANVTVKSATSKSIDLEAKVQIDSRTTIQGVLERFKSRVKNELRREALKASYISYAKLGTYLLETEGVIDYQDLKLNNGVANIAIGEEEVALLNNINLEVI